MTKHRLRTGVLARVVGAAMLLAPSIAFAQGNLSTQGLGYHPGQLSTAAGSMGGSIGEIDPFSPINPAALGLMTTPIVFFQAEPEYRKLQFGTQTLTSSVSRFPLFLGAMTLGDKWALAISASTLVDRTWATTQRDTQFIGPDTLAGAITDKSDGSIEDLQLAVSYGLTSWFHVGVSGHAYSGRDVINNLRVFDDTARFAGTSQQTTLSFGGNAVSVGALALWPRIGAIGVTYRYGGDLRVYEGETVLGSGSVPNHLGVSVAYLGLRGTTIAARAVKDDWSATRGLAAGLNTHETWEYGFGADVTGPKLGASPIALRAGARFRTLPFSVSSTPVDEKTYSGGFGFPFAGGRVELHLGVYHASRTSGNLSEGAWTISTGFGIRP